ALTREVDEGVRGIQAEDQYRPGGLEEQARHYDKAVALMRRAVAAGRMTWAAFDCTPGSGCASSQGFALQALGLIRPPPQLVVRIPTNFDGPRVLPAILDGGARLLVKSHEGLLNIISVADGAVLMPINVPASSVLAVQPLANSRITLLAVADRAELWD